MMHSSAMRFSEIDSRLRRLLGDERGVQVDFLLCLEEFERVNGYEDLEYATLWDYCRRELGLLDCAIARRVQSMRILRKYPVAEAYLRDGRLCMTGIGMLEKVLTAENHIEIFDRASWKSAREIAAIAVESNAPVPEKAVLRKLPAPATRIFSLEFPASEKAHASVAEVPENVIATGGLAIGVAVPIDAMTNTTGSPVPGVAPPTPGAARLKQRVIQVSPRQYKLTLVVGDDFKAKLDRVKKILSHAIPDGNLEAVISRALDLVIAKDDKRHGAPIAKKKARRAAREKSVVDTTDAAVAGSAAVAVGDAVRSAIDDVVGVGVRGTGGETPPEREYIPVDVMKALWARDEGKCCWELASGQTCGSEFQLEPDHKIPVAVGGRSSLSNLRLLCRQHNLLAARRAFGESFMAKFRARA